MPDTEGNIRTTGDRIPVPDPTKLTNEAIDRVTLQYRRELGQLQRLFETRMDGTDTDRLRLWEVVNGQPALQQSLLERSRREFLEDLVSVRTILEQQISLLNDTRRSDSSSEREFIMSQIQNVRDVMSEKFTAVDGRFGESKVAVDAAFAAAKEAVAEQNKSNAAAIGVSETNTKEQLQSLGRVTDAGLAGLRDKVEDARTRLTGLEQRTEGIKENKGDISDERRESHDTRTRTTNQITVALFSLSVLVSLIALVLTVAFHK